MAKRDAQGLPIPGAPRIVQEHDALLLRADWPDRPVPSPGRVEHEVWPWIRRNHEFNARLWREEDLARRTRVSDGEIAANKRAIDRFNQQRNDATERVDEILLLALGLVDPESVRSDAPVTRAAPEARWHSETAGSMIDRLSILALKIAAMREQCRRGDLDPAHRQACQVRLDRLLEQRDDLMQGLDRLLDEARSGRAYFKVYRQFKLYNDARFNPALVAEASAPGPPHPGPSEGPGSRDAPQTGGTAARCSGEGG